MWCPSCRADVAAELSTDNRRMLCARCQTELGMTSTAASQMTSLPRAAETERDARELLARWSAQNLLDVPAPSIGAGAFAKPNGSVDLPLTRPELRFDSARATVPPPSSPFLAAAITKPGSSVISLNESGSVPTRQDEPAKQSKTPTTRLSHESIPGTAPSDDASQMPQARPQPMDSRHQVSPALPVVHTHAQPRPRPTWTMMAGQICAYAGVGLLTCGTVLVMWSYFGGPSKYLPTGWLTAAVGQMVLFLGIITLISSGMEQTISEVGWRVDFLAEEVHHTEMALTRLEREQRKARHRRTDSQARPKDDHSSREAA